MFGVFLLLLSTTMPVGCSVAHNQYPQLFGDCYQHLTGLTGSTFLLTVLTAGLGFLAIQESNKGE